MGKRIAEAVISALLIALGTKLIEKAFEKDDEKGKADEDDEGPTD